MARTGSRGSRVPSFAILLLLNEIFRMATSYGIPTVTAIFTAAQVCLFLGYIKVPWSDAWDVCISVDRAYYRRDWKRLVFSAFEHGDDWHLYYNMVSFLYKGRDLEKRFGSVRFFIILAVFTILTSFTYIGLNLAFFNLTANRGYLQSCAVGFSGVIFALKVLTTHYSPRGHQSFMGISIPTKYAFWAELVLIQIISSNASFVGHLAGILVGLAYTMGPLKVIIDAIESIVSGVVPFSSADRRFGRRSRRRHDSSDYDDHSNRMSEEEQLRRATEESLRDSRRQPTYPTSSSYSASPPYPTNDPPYPTSSGGDQDASPSAPPYPTVYPDLDELRRRREDKYTSWRT